MTLLFAVIAAWTNTAKQVVLATPVELRGARVVMNCRDGGEREYPLSIFPTDEQRRIKASFSRSNSSGQPSGMLAGRCQTKTSPRKASKLISPGKRLLAMRNSRRTRSPIGKVA